MPSISAVMVRQEMPAVSTLLYTVPASKKGAVVHIIAVNRSEAADAPWWLWLPESGDAPSDANIIVPGTKQWDIPAGYNIDYHTWAPVAPGSTIWGYSTGSVTIHIGGELRNV